MRSIRSVFCASARMTFATLNALATENNQPAVSLSWAPERRVSQIRSGKRASCFTLRPMLQAAVWGTEPETRTPARTSGTAAGPREPEAVPPAPVQEGEPSGPRLVSNS